MFILASASPRRAEILSEIIPNFEVVSSNFEEKIDDLLPPEQIVADLTYGKGREVLGRYPEGVIIAGDTIVYFDFKPLGKAGSRTEAWQMLHDISGQKAQIYTGNGLFQAGKCLIHTTVVEVEFRTLRDEFIDGYLDDPAADWMDKAGAFAVQGQASKFTTVTGEWSTALGLSKSFLQEHLLKFETLIG